MPQDSFLQIRLNTASKTELPVVVVFGATATGKTALLEHLFARGSHSPFAGEAEIISADSMQVYCGMNIGTAKPEKQLLERLPHHLIDLFSPREQFTAGEFVRRSDELCLSIYNRGLLPVIAGGTAFYIRNFLYGLPKTPQADEETRQLLKEKMRIQGAAAMHRYLAQLDNLSAGRIHVNDEYRILRALEVCVSSGRPLSSFTLEERYRSPYRFLVISLDRKREDLNRRIEKRVDYMFNQGLVEEFKTLLQAGFTASDPGMQAIGYREFFTAGCKVTGDISAKVAEKAMALIKTNSKKYAKRQTLFFKSVKGALSFSADNQTSIADAVKNFMHEI